MKPASTTFIGRILSVNFRRRLLKPGIDQQRIWERTLLIQIDKSDHDAMEIIRPVDNSELQSVHVRSLVVESDLHAVNVGIFAYVSRRQLNSCDRKLLLVVINYGHLKSNDS